MGKKQKVNRGYKTSQVILASCAFAACTVFWGIYNSFVPLILDSKLTSLGTLSVTVISTLTGFIMTIDNLFGLIFQPMFGRKSDSTRSKWGKRMPYLIVGVPVCAVLFILIPIVAKAAGTAGILLMMLVVILFNFVMSTWRAPCVAIMPDIVPPKYQSEGNAIVNMVAAVASLLAGLAATVLGAMGFKAAIDAGDFTSVFIFGSVLAAALFALAWVTVKWNDNRNDLAVTAKKEGACAEPKESFRNMGISKEAKKSMVIMMIALFFISGANDGFSTYFTLYATKLLGMDAARASLIKTAGMLGAVCLAVPAGILGRKIGRRKTIILGLTIMVSTHAIMYFMPMISTNPDIPIAVLYFLNWAGMILVNINTLPIMLSIGGPKRFGAFTGYYYTATFTAAVVCPTVIGFLVGVTNSYNTANVFAIVCLVGALLCVYNVKHGEADSEEYEAELEEAVRAASAD